MKGTPRFGVLLGLLLVFSAATGLAQRTFGTLVIVEAEPVPAGPSPLSASSPAEWRFVELVYAPLFGTTATGAFVPVLADKMTVQDGGKRLVVSLKAGVQWSIGKDIVAPDVVYTYTLARAGKWNHAYVDLLASVESVRRSDDGFDVVFELTRAVKNPTRLLTVPLIPSGLHGPLSDPSRQRPLPLGVIGAGPYRARSEQTRGQLVLNPNSVVKPHISEVRIVSAGSRRMALDYVRLHGDAVTFDVAPKDNALLSIEGGPRVLRRTRQRIEAIAFHPRETLLGDGYVLRAVKSLLDRSALGTRGERFRPSAAPVPKGDPAYPKGLKVPPYDVVEAERILWWEGGWVRLPEERWFHHKDQDGAAEQLIMPLLVDADDREAMRRAYTLAARFAHAGIKLEVDPRPRLEFRSRVRSREFPAALVSLEVPRDGDLSPLFHSAGGANVTGLADKTVDAALEAGDRAAAVAAIVRSDRLLFLGIRTDMGLAGRSVVAPSLGGRGGLSRIQKWRIK